MAGRGSAPGERRGGRQKGTPNKVTVKRAAEIAESGKTPLDFMLSVLRDEDASIKERMWAAVAAAPYCHAKPRPVAANAGGRTVNVEIRRFSDERSLLQIDRDARATHGEDAQAQVRLGETPMDRLEAQWFNPDSQQPAPTPTPTPPPTLQEAKPPDRPHGNGAGPPQRMNGVGHPERANGGNRPQRGNGADARRSHDELRNIRTRPRRISDYPATHPVHGVV